MDQEKECRSRRAPRPNAQGLLQKVAHGLGMAALGALLSAASVASAEEHKPAKENEMKILKKTDPSTVEGPDNWFTGTAWIEPVVSEPESPSQVTAARVTFEPGARTNWHKHPLGQMLIVTEGVGWTQVEGEEKVEFGAGDVMTCPKDKRHWHGATPDAAMTHIAVQEMFEGKNVQWFEPVSDEDYLGK